MAVITCLHWRNPFQQFLQESFPLSLLIHLCTLNIPRNEELSYIFYGRVNQSVSFVIPEGIHTMSNLTKLENGLNMRMNNNYLLLLCTDASLLNKICSSVHGRYNIQWRTISQWARSVLLNQWMTSPIGRKEEQELRRRKFC